MMNLGQRAPAVVVLILFAIAAIDPASQLLARAQTPSTTSDR